MGGLLLAGVICASQALPVAAQSEAAQQEVSFTSAEGAEIGSATLTGTPYGLLIRLDLRDLRDLPPETWHGFHIHETGECDPADGFKSAGGHFSVSATNHGLLVEEGPHSGDMPNQYVAADGTLKAEVLNTYAFLGGEADNVSGRALMLHSGPDDYQSQPSGDAGERIACAVID
ncbi:superoxide dismutase family protein [Marinovum sp.]|uniref:superoxide dismutase family protein n=1 Tax=Marinovum sp. TaxID=2024839 RepID=UPI002B267846|nr:superoxide dismutase family protein [Marinovum sp.]